MKTIKISSIEVIKLEGGDAGDMNDAMREAVILAMKTNHNVTLRTGTLRFTIDPMSITTKLLK